MSNGSPSDGSPPSNGSPSSRSLLLAACIKTVCLAALMLCGCHRTRQADYSELELVEVSGRVTLDGQPLTHANVLFESEDASSSYGRTDENGDYKLLFNSEKSGCLPGKKIVRITMGPVGDEVDPDAVGPDDLPAKYNTESRLSADVSQDRRRFDFDL